MNRSFNNFRNYTVGEALPFAPEAIYVGVAGILRLRDAFGNTADFLCPAGATVLTDTVEIVTGTTAEGLVLQRYISK